MARTVRWLDVLIFRRQGADRAQSRGPASFFLNAEELRRLRLRRVLNESPQAAPGPRGGSPGAKGAPLRPTPGCPAQAGVFAIWDPLARRRLPDLFGRPGVNLEALSRGRPARCRGAGPAAALICRNFATLVCRRTPGRSSPATCARAYQPSARGDVRPCVCDPPSVLVGRTGALSEALQSGCSPRGGKSSWKPRKADPTIPGSVVVRELPRPSCCARGLIAMPPGAAIAAEGPRCRELRSKGPFQVTGRSQGLRGQR